MFAKSLPSVWPFCCSLNETEESLRVRRTPWKLMMILAVIISDYIELKMFRMIILAEL